ncbi:hypothetical protein [Acinetobacter gyllenbergii]|uniref:hypothetical protein n=1 Tax=Acinetobacter gyllenbergii TaxID=134534 RepID=UPI0003BF2C70|nr:hypothetical protein [Acinetobacter gyllenbergii]ESK55688.1 hypothetical protein F987_00519 [Acinetobacter gyllenbergii NIPH 230]
MTDLEKAKFVTDLLNGLSPLFIAAFLFGILVGVFFFGRIVDVIDRLGSRLRRPKRIKAVRDFKEHGDFEYLYLFQGRYYSLGEYQERKKQVFSHHDAYLKFLKQEKQAAKNKGI